MPTITTCGHESKRKTFTYRGNINEGITFEFSSGDFEIPADVIGNVLNHFDKQYVRGGFSMTAPASNGVGEFLSEQSNSLTPRHASFLCAAMRHEGYVSCELNGNAVMVNFNSESTS